MRFKVDTHGKNFRAGFYYTKDVIFYKIKIEILLNGL